MGLAKYNEKRHFDKTPEPKGVTKKKSKKRATAERLYLVQKHAASRLHYDFRLEHNGVLLSWAVPKGPSFDTRDKRLAVHVEDHPVAYGDFEGSIPEGEYGGGTVMLWDRGTWEPLGDMDAMYREGKVKFVVHGEKLNGAWTLVRIRGRGKDDGKNWLLIKERDDAVQSHDDYDVTAERDESVKTGRSMSEIAADKKNVWKSNRAKSAEIDAAGLTGAKKTTMPATFSPQLATLATKVPEGKDWIYELKLDGYRLLAFADGKRARMLTRKGNDWTTKFATVAASIGDIACPAILDGEVCVVRDNGTTDFQALQNAIGDGRNAKLVYFVFDMPWCNGYDLRATPLHERKELLKRVLAPAAALGKSLIFGDHIEGKGDAVWQHACAMGMEGVIAKRRDGAYITKRSASWLKIKCTLRQELVVIGFTKAQGERTGFGALSLGYYDDGGELVYAGRVGTGFDEKTLQALTRELKKRTRKTSALAKALRGPEAKDVTWVEPELVAEVRFAEWTGEGVVRQAAFMGLRADKAAKDVRREKAKATTTAVREAKQEEVVEKPTRGRKKPATKAARAVAKATRSVAHKDEKADEVNGVRITHPSRVVYPNITLTKIELVRYYERAAERILPYVANRPLSLVRCQQGAGKPCFFQKHVDHPMPGFHGVDVRDKEHKGEYLYIQDEVGLLQTIQMGALELHPWASTVKKLEHPQYMVFDLDPGPGVVWDSILEGALVLRARLEELGLASYVRTSGGKGLHVCVPLAQKNDWDEVKTFSRLVTERLAAREPRKYVAVMTKSDRGGRIFIDYLRNGRGATAVASWSTRARDNAPIAVPLEWTELDSIDAANVFTIANIDERLDKADPWEDFFATKQSITKAMVKAVSA